MSNTAKDKSILIRLTKDEHDRLVEQARNADQPVAWYVRRKLFAEIHPKPRKRK
jgi:predicted DNA-binding protein